MSENNFAKLAAINVNDHIEKKNGLSYLSWPFAVSELMKAILLRIGSFISRKCSATP